MEYLQEIKQLSSIMAYKYQNDCYGPPLEQKDINLIEQELNVKLRDDLKVFLTIFGGGAGGKIYGLTNYNWYKYRGDKFTLTKQKAYFNDILEQNKYYRSVGLNPNYIAIGPTQDGGVYVLDSNKTRNIKIFYPQNSSTLQDSELSFKDILKNIVLSFKTNEELLEDLTVEQISKYTDKETEYLLEIETLSSIIAKKQQKEILGPPLKQEQISFIEQELNVKLRGELKIFLKILGGGLYDMIYGLPDYQNITHTYIEPQEVDIILQNKLLREDGLDPNYLAIAPDSTGGVYVLSPCGNLRIFYSGAQYEGVEYYEKDMHQRNFKHVLEMLVEFS